MIRASLAALRDFVIVSLVLGLVFVICAIMATRTERVSMDYSIPLAPLNNGHDYGVCINGQRLCINEDENGDFRSSAGICEVPPWGMACP